MTVLNHTKATLGKRSHYYHTVHIVAPIIQSRENTDFLVEPLALGDRFLISSTELNRILPNQLNVTQKGQWELTSQKVLHLSLVLWRLNHPEFLVG